MSVHRYPAAAVVADCARAGAGACIAGGPLLMIETAPIVAAVLASIVGLFAAYAGVSVVRYLTRIEIDDRGIAAQGPIATTVAWRDLRDVRLAYYSTRRDRSGGWLQLTVADDHHHLRVDSRIGEFDKVTACTVAAARCHGLRLDPTTISNMQAMGIGAEPVPEMEGGN